MYGDKKKISFFVWLKGKMDGWITEEYTKGTFSYAMVIDICPFCLQVMTYY